MRRTLKILFILSMAAVISAFILNILIDNPYTHSLVRYAINDKLEKHTHLRVDYKSISLSMFPPQIDLFNFTLYDRENLEQSLLSSDKTSARLSFTDLFFGEVRLSRVELVGLALDFSENWLKELLAAANPQSETNTPSEDTPDKPLLWPPQRELPVDTIVLTGVSFRQKIILAEDDSMVLNLNGINLEIEYDSWSDILIKGRLEDVTALRNEIPFIQHGKIDLSADWNVKSLFLQKLSIKSAEQDLQVEGRFDLITEPIPTDLKRSEKTLAVVGLEPSSHKISYMEGKITAKGKGDLSPLGASLNIPDTDGMVTLADSSLQIRIPIQDNRPFSLQVDAKGKAHHARIYEFSLLDSEFEVGITQDEITFRDIDLMTGDTKHGKGKGFIKFNDALDMEFTADLKQVGLKHLLSALTVKDFNVLDFDMGAQQLLLKATGFPFSMQVTAGVRLDQFKIPLLEIEKSEWTQSPTCKFQLNLDINADHLHFMNNKGQCRSTGDLSDQEESKLNLDGRIHFNEKGIGLNVDGQVNLDLANYFLQRSFTGAGQIKTSIQGPYEKIMVNTSLQSKALSIEGIKLQNLDADTRYDVNASKLHWKKINLDGEDLALKSEGQLHIAPELNLKTKTHVSKMSKQSSQNFFQNILKLKTAPMFDLSNSTIEFDGSIYKPLQANSQVNVHLHDFWLDQEQIASDISLDATGDRDDWRINELAWNLHDLALKMTGTQHNSCNNKASKNPGLQAWGLCDDNAIQANIEVKGRSVEKKEEPTLYLAGLPFIGNVFKNLKIDTRPDLKVEVSGRIAVPEIVIDGEFASMQAKATQLAPIKVRSFLKDGHWNSLFSQQGDAFVGKLEIDLNKDQLPYEWFFTFRRFDIRLFGGAWFAEDPRNYAYLSGSWEWQGRLKDWWRSEGKINIDEVWVNYVGEVGGQSRSLNLQLTQPMSLVADGQQWELLQGEGINLESDLAKIAVYPKVLRPPQEMNLFAEAYIDLRAISLVSNIFESTTGKVHVQLELDGSVYEPHLRVEFRDVKKNRFNAGTWEPVSIGLADLRPPLQNIEIDASYSNEVLTIKQIQGEKGTGTFLVKGALTLPSEDSDNNGQVVTPLSPPGISTDLNIQFNDIRLIYPVAVFKSFETQASGNLTISGNAAPYNLRGDVNIVKARSTRDFDIRNEIIEALRRNKFTKTETVVKNTFDLDVNVRADETIQIANRNVQAVLSTDLRVIGNEQRPVVLGQLDITKGKIVYKRDFTLSRGIISFMDPLKPDPNLDIQAVSEISPYRVFLSVTGKASEPVVDMTVEPSTRPDGAPITKVDILTLISRGRLPETTNLTQDSTTSDTVSSEVVNIFVSQFEEPVEKILSLSGQDIVNQIQLESYISEDDGSQGVRVGLPFNLTNEWDLILRTEVPLTSTATKKDNWSINSEYSLTDHLFLHGNVDRATQSVGEKNVEVGGSVDLKFRFGFQ